MLYTVHYMLHTVHWMYYMLHTAHYTLDTTCYQLYIAATMVTYAFFVSMMSHLGEKVNQAL